MAAIESQMCKVRTVISDALLGEARISESTVVLNLKDGITPWVMEIMNGKCAEEVKEKSLFDISLQAVKLTDFYRSIIYGREDSR